MFEEVEETLENARVWSAVRCLTMIKRGPAVVEQMMDERAVATTDGA